MDDQPIDLDFPFAFDPFTWGTREIDARLPNETVDLNERMIRNADDDNIIVKNYRALQKPMWLHSYEGFGVKYITIMNAFTHGDEIFLFQLSSCAFADFYAVFQQFAMEVGVSNEAIMAMENFKEFFSYLHRNSVRKHIYNCDLMKVGEHVHAAAA